MNIRKFLLPSAPPRRPIVSPALNTIFRKPKAWVSVKTKIQKAVDIAVKVRGGAHMVMKGAIEKTMKQDSASGKGCCGETSTCCG